METPNNNPEKRQGPLTDNCDKCGEDYELTPDNTVLLGYSVDDHMDNVICRCPHCSWRTRIFIGRNTFAQAVNNGIEPIIEKYAGNAVVNDFEELRGMERIETYELTNRHEAIIHRFGEIILAMPDQMLYDGFHDETNKPYPQKWID